MGKKYKIQLFMYSVHQALIQLSTNAIKAPTSSTAMIRMRDTSPYLKYLTITEAGVINYIPQHMLEKGGHSGKRFNLDSNAYVSTNRDYFHILQSNVFSNLITKPTRVTSTSQTSIDHILTNDSKSSIKPGVFHYTISDHFLIVCEITIPRNKPPSKPLTNPYTY